MSRRPPRSLLPMSDEDWLRERPPHQCVAPGCTARGKRRVPAVVDADRESLPGLRELLCLCDFHYRALADRVVIACWGVPPGNVLWRCGAGDMARWYLNERRLTPKQVERWMRTPAALLT